MQSLGKLKRQGMGLFSSRRIPASREPAEGRAYLAASSPSFMQILPSVAFPAPASAINGLARPHYILRREELNELMP
jgi:hypothetical protein